MKTGTELITAERTRQMDEEGWSPSHDDTHEGGELADAGACYANLAAAQSRGATVDELRDLYFGAFAELPWPFAECWWKPSDDPIRNLVKAGALIAAEIDRLQRRANRGAAIGHDPGLMSTRQ